MKESIDRLRIISHSKKELKSMRFRYLSKSVFVNCKADTERFKCINFRGAHFSRTIFINVSFIGCDFWGTTFKKCKFINTLFRDCVFQGCIFRSCDFSGNKMAYSAIVNTNTEDCSGLEPDDTTVILSQYPKIEF